MISNIMAPSEKETNLQNIIKKLEGLGCDELETLEPQWVYSVLVSPGRPRQNLLKWVFARLSPTEYSDLSSVSAHAQDQKILQSLICMGICQPGDTDIIEGSAPEITQLKFWRTCLDVIQHLQNFSQSNPQVSSALLSHLAHSPHLLPTLKEGDATLIPEDLKDKYQTWCKHQKHISVSDSLKRVKEQLSEEQEKHKSLEKWEPISSAEEHQSLQTSVEKALTNLTKEQEVLQGVYTTYIAPWPTSTPHLDLPTTGPLVEEANSKLSSYVKTLKTTEDILQNCEKLEEQEKAILKEALHPSSITTILHSLVTDTRRPHDV